MEAAEEDRVSHRRMTMTASRVRCDRGARRTI